MLGEGKFRYWKSKREGFERYVVVWVNLNDHEHVDFLEWCRRSHISLFLSVTSKDNEPTEIDYDGLIREFNERIATHPNLAKEPVQAKWYAVDNEEHLMLMKMKWS